MAVPDAGGTDVNAVERSAPHSSTFDIDDHKSEPPSRKSWANVAATPLKGSDTTSMQHEPTKAPKDVEEVASLHHAKQMRDAASKREYILNNDWRSPLLAVNDVAPVHAKDDMRSRREFRSGARTLAGCLHQDLKPGTIVWYRDKRALFDESSVPHGWTIFKDSHGNGMIQKGRHHVIVENLPSPADKFEVMEAAIYSNRDTGLQSTSVERHHEYMSLCSQHMDATSIENLVPENPLLKIDWMRSKPGESPARKHLRPIRASFDLHIVCTSPLRLARP